MDEFYKAGFTKEAATVVKPPMVKESKAKLECRVLEVKELGKEGGAGNLLLFAKYWCFIWMILFSTISKDRPGKLDLVARLGGDWYARISKENLFQVPKPNTQLGIGIDALPAPIRMSKVLTGNHLARLANVHEFPSIDKFYHDEHLNNILDSFGNNAEKKEAAIHQYVFSLLDNNKIPEAWQVLLKLYPNSAKDF